MHWASTLIFKIRSGCPARLSRNLLMSCSGISRAQSSRVRSISGAFFSAALRSSAIVGTAWASLRELCLPAAQTENAECKQSDQRKHTEEQQSVPGVTPQLSLLFGLPRFRLAALDFCLPRLLRSPLAVECFLLRIRLARL